MAPQTTKNSATPQPIIEDFWAAWKTQALVAAVELDVFTPMARAPRTAMQIVAATGGSARGVPPLLDALVAMGYLRKAGSRYGLRPLAAAFLVRGGQRFMGGMASTASMNWNAWAHLPDAVRTGRPFQAVDAVKRGKEFFPRLVAAIFPGSFAAARAAVAALPARTRKGIRRILDVAAGSGAWSLAFAQAIPEAKVTVVDLSEVTPITRKFVKKFGFAKRYDYLEGDLRKLDFGRGKFDLVILGHIIHSEGEKHGRALVERSAAALRPGGMLLIGELIPNDSRTGPLLPVLFGLNMLLQTDNGGVFTLREYRAWLKRAGFPKVRTIRAPSPSPLILATKSASPR